MNLIRANVPRIAARAYIGLWIVDCGGCPQSYRTQPGAPVTECWRCGTTTEIVWPSQEMIRGIERLLSMRPDELNRNWVPGETLVDLMVENGKHGVFDQFEPVASGTPLLSVEEERIRVDHLPALDQRTRKAVGA